MKIYHAKWKNLKGAYGYSRRRDSDSLLRRVSRHERSVETQREPLICPEREERVDC